MNFLKRASLYAKGFTKGLIDPSGMTNNSGSGNVNLSWFGVGGSFGGHDDEKLMREGYMGNSDVSSIINAIADAPIDVSYEIKKAGEILDSGITYDIIHGDSKEHISSKIEKAMINLASSGDLFIWKMIGAFTYPTNIKVLRSASIDIITNNAGEIVHYLYREFGNTITYSVDEIIHIKNYNPQDDLVGNHRGLNKFVAGYNSLKASNNRDVASAHTLENLGVSGIISDKAGDLVDPTESEEFNKNFIEKLKGAHKSGQFYVTSADIEVHELGKSPRDLEITKSAPILLRKIAALFNVSSRPFNDPEGSTYNNSAVDDKNFFIKGVKPMVRKIILGISLDLSQYETGITIEPNYSLVEALQEDQTKEIEKNGKKDEILSKLLANATLSNLQKIFILVNIHGMEEGVATKLVNDGKDQNEGNTAD